MSRMEFLERLRKYLYIISDLRTMKNKAETDLNNYVEMIREIGAGPIDQAIVKGHKQKVLEVEILERMIVYINDLNQDRIDASLKALGRATTNEYSNANAILEHIDETISKVVQQIHGDDEPPSNGPQN